MDSEIDLDVITPLSYQRGYNRVAFLQEARVYSEQSCPICTDTIQLSTEKAAIYYCGCTQLVHLECAAAIIKNALETATAIQCPLCRKERDVFEVYRTPRLFLVASQDMLSIAEKKQKKLARMSEEEKEEEEEGEDSSESDEDFVDDESETSETGDELEPSDTEASSTT